jgi:hypothetical protein
VSRLDEIIALLLVTVTAGIAWLLSQSATVTLGVAFSASALLGTLLSPHALRPGRAREVPPQGQNPQQPFRVVQLLAVVVKVMLTFVAPAAIIGLFGDALPETWRSIAKVLVLVSVLAMPFEKILDVLVNLAGRASVPRRKS